MGQDTAPIWGKPAELEALFFSLTGQDNLERLDDHGVACKTSCHDCMRDYSNLAYHSILDWRLALDLARLALNPKAVIDFTPSYWQGITEVAAQRLHEALPGSELTYYAGLPVCKIRERSHHRLTSSLGCSGKQSLPFSFCGKR